MSEAARVLLVGSTGLVGREVIAQGRGVPGLSLLALARREVRLPRGGRMELMLAPVDDWPQAITTISPDAVICTLGTTRAQAGREGLREVDCALVLRVAEAAHRAGARQFVHLSSVGANPNARAHYLSVKGEAEQGLRKLGFQRLDILRPGLLRGKREGERRVLEGIGQIVAPVADLFLHGSRRRYRSVRAHDAAAALLQAVRNAEPGTFVHDYDAMRRLAHCFGQGASA